MMITQTEINWWKYLSPAIQMQLQIKYFPNINWKYLNIQEIKLIYQNESIKLRN
jgi:hypothetical protein